MNARLSAFGKLRRAWRERDVRAPVIEREVHVGAGATMVGPIRVGARSKVTANCFVRTTIPPDSLVEAPAPTISIRSRSEPR